MKNEAEMIEVMQAHARGEVIECANQGSDAYIVINNPSWNWPNVDYRIKALAVVEGKPVYKGASLYRTDGSRKDPLIVTGACDQQDKTLGVLLQVEGAGCCWANNLSWEAPKATIILTTMVDLEQGDTKVVVADSYEYMNAIADGYKHIHELDKEVSVSL